MKIAVRYYTRTGNTKKLADAIALAAGVSAETIDSPVDTETDVLFLGSSVYAFEVDEKVAAFINGLERDRVKLVVNFSTAALVKSTYNSVSKLLAAKEIPLDKREFHCRGKFKFMHTDRPNEKDIADAKRFASQIIGQ